MHVLYIVYLNYTLLLTLNINSASFIQFRFELRREYTLLAFYNNNSKELTNIKENVTNGS